MECKLTDLQQADTKATNKIKFHTMQMVTGQKV